jgi:transposase
MTITTIGIDLAKDVFQVQGIDERGKVILRKQLKRAQMAPNLAPWPKRSDHASTARSLRPRCPGS